MKKKKKTPKNNKKKKKKKILTIFLIFAQKHVASMLQKHFGGSAMSTHKISFCGEIRKTYQLSWYIDLKKKKKKKEELLKC